MSSPLPIIMLMSGMPGMPSEGICIPDPPSIDFELVEVLDDDEDMVEDEEDIMEDILEDMPPVDIIPLEGPPNFMSPIIFFIMSSMSPPMSMPRDIMGGPPAMPGPPDVEVMVELEDEEEEKDMDDLVVPSGLWVEAAII